MSSELIFFWVYRGIDEQLGMRQTQDSNAHGLRKLETKGGHHVKSGVRGAICKLKKSHQGGL